MAQLSTSPEPGRIAILGGTGPEGSGLAMRWARAGFRVLIGSRDLARAETAAARISQAAETGAGGGRFVASITGMANPEAAAQADTVVLTVPFAAQLATLKAVHDALRSGQVLVDVTVPLATAVGGRATHLLGVWQGSAAQSAAAAVPRGVAVVSAFHSVSAVHLERLDAPVDCDVLVCGDHAPAKERVRQLVEAIPGCRYLDAGPLANARTVEALTALLIGINMRYKVPGAGIRLTGLGPRS